MRLSPRQLVLGIFCFFALSWLSGCSEGYSNAVVYELRQDPFLNSEVKLPTLPTEFLYKADPPGQLPLMNLKAIGDSRNPYFHFDDQTKQKLFVDPNKIRTEERKVFTQTLNQLFGSPGKPRVTIPDDSGSLDFAKIDELKVDEATLARGSQLYRLHCLACHGVPGDGRGPTAQWVNPHPRDFRAGLFKFQSVNQAKFNYKIKPSRADLYRTLYQGVEGTAMPAFNLLAPDELEALVSYVIHLSIRGETELQTFQSLKANQSGELASEKAEDLPGIIMVFARQNFQVWEDSQKNLIKVDPYPKYTAAEKKASILRGQALYLQDYDLVKKHFPKEVYVSKYSNQFDGKGAKDVTAEDYEKQLKAFVAFANCITCHQDYGRQSEFKLDEWGTLVKPANWTLGVYRGGRRPVDLYFRIHSGINGSGMTAFWKEKGGLNGEQIWDLVNFIQTIPYPAMRSQYGVEIK